MMTDIEASQKAVKHGEKAPSNPVDEAKMPSTAAVDDGFAYTKVAWLDPRTRKIQTHAIASRARSGLHLTSNLEGQSEGGYKTDDLKFSVGNFSDPLDTRDNEYPYSAMNRVIVHHALRSSGFAQDGDQAIESLGVTIPFQTYYSDPKKVLERRAESLSRSVQTAIEGYSGLILKREGIRVYPEAAIAWVDHILDDQGNDAADVEDPVAVIDVGGRTTDVAVMPNGRGQMDMQASGTDQIGVMDIIQDIRRMIDEKYGIQTPMEVAEKAMRQKSVLMYGKTEDVSTIVADAKRQVAEQIYRSVYRRLGEGAFLKKLIFVGGGSSVMREALEQYPHVEVPRAPEFANARGVLKYLLFRSQG